jgi:hypothetical protein
VRFNGVVKIDKSFDLNGTLIGAFEFNHVMPFCIKVRITRSALPLVCGLTTRMNFARCRAVCRHWQSNVTQCPCFAAVGMDVVNLIEGLRQHIDHKKATMPCWFVLKGRRFVFKAPIHLNRGLVAPFAFVFEALLDER